MDILITLKLAKSVNITAFLHSNIDCKVLIKNKQYLLMPE